MPRRRPSEAMMQHGTIPHSGTLLEHYLKQGMPPTEEELESLYQMYLAEEDVLSFMLTYINTQSDWDLWKKANPAEREALQKRKEIKDLFLKLPIWLAGKHKMNLLTVCLPATKRKSQTNHGTDG